MLGAVATVRAATCPVKTTATRTLRKFRPRRRTQCLTLGCADWATISPQATPAGSCTRARPDALRPGGQCLTLGCADSATMSPQPTMSLRPRTSLSSPRGEIGSPRIGFAHKEMHRAGDAFVRLFRLTSAEAVAHRRAINLWRSVLGASSNLWTLQASVKSPKQQLSAICGFFFSQRPYCGRACLL